ncbi:MAG: AAA family ATPase, partial [Verrucomicrobia bacterium]|nr:AAA family ATPase [Verrucomicrobiota bacterium]
MGLDNPVEFPWIEISGAMGIGKTRLVRAAISGRGTRVIHVLASRLACRRPLGFMRQLIESCMGTLCTNSMWLSGLDAFEAALAALSTDVEMFAEVLWPLIAPEGTVEVSREDPATRRRRLERGLSVFMEALGQAHACLLWLDSYELADAASAELLESIARTGVPENIQFVVLQRTDARAAVFPTTQMTLSGLSDANAEQLLTQQLLGTLLPDGLRNELLQRAEGVPLFIEEMIQSMRENGTLAGPADGPWQFSPTSSGSHAPLPASIRAAMTSRLDRLSNEAGLILCEASIQGSEFHPEVIRRLHQDARDDAGHESVDAIFAELQRLGLVESRSVGTTEVLAFSNPIMEDVCYERLVPADRKSLHQRTASILLDMAGNDGHVSSDLLAHHYEAAELWREAAESYLRSGDSAADLFVNTGAVSHYRHSLSAAGKVSDSAGVVNRLLAPAHERLAALALRMGDYALAHTHAVALCRAAPSSRELAEGYRMRALAARYKG